VNVTYGFLCDYATVSQEGKLSILGIFSDISVGEMPARHPQAFLAFELEFSYAEVNAEFPLRIECVDEDGRAVFKADGQAQLSGHAKPGQRPRIVQALQLNDLTFEQAGRYDINIFVNNELKRTIEFTVTTRPPDEEEIPEA
jgi:hypothetical protein